MRIGLDISQHQLTWAELVERTRFADEAGFDGAWVFDHFKPLYGPSDGPCLEGWTLLAGLAAETKRIRLGALVTGVTYRPPSILATEAVTVDHISGGRLELGMGAAWNEREHRALGLDFPTLRERAQRLEEAVQLMRLLMTRDRTTFNGQYYRLQNATYRPRPVQRPHPPIWIGAGGERLMLPIVARQADAWHSYGSVRELVRKSAILDDHTRRAGRDPHSILRSTSLSLSEPWDRVRRRAQELRRAGFSYLIADWPSEGKRHLEQFVARVMPELTTA